MGKRESDMRNEISALVEREHQNAKRFDEKDMRSFRQKINEQKNKIEELEQQLRRCSVGASVVSPGEFSKMARSAEVLNGCFNENASLVQRNRDFETEAVILRKENVLLKRQLPNNISEAIANEARDSVKFEDCDEKDASLCREQPSPVA